ncbi:uncharacterized protein LOC125568098 [Nematostella vectensis]|uniref:uncharacterized protein LOC125568098 n=1 Tax=Nematostella vectensis TaxID=45351 RepID=UPI00207796BA|nr:uncharacterized protein LOC125568098 [Nematostella vectensis]
MVERVIHDRITHIGGLKKLEVSKQLLDAASQGRRRYVEYLDEQRKAQAKTIQENRKRKCKEREEDLEEKRMRLSCEIASLQFDTDKFANEAEETAQLFLLTKSNALRKCAKEKQKALKDVEDELADLTLKAEI